MPQSDKRFGILHNSRRALAQIVKRCFKTGETLRFGDADTQPISWKSAQEEASKWLGDLKLGRDLFGKKIDLSDKGAMLPFDGRFREMVLQSAREKFKKRGAKDIILPV